jgi:uncharacterized RDD family membrane protein YckC
MMRGAEMSVQDPRSVVTPYAFRVAPDLLGLPLAGPVRRLLGMLIDLGVVAVLSLLGWAATLTFLFVTLIFVLTARGGAFGHPLVRMPVRVLAVLLLVGILVGRPVSWIRSLAEQAVATQAASVAAGPGDAGEPGTLDVQIHGGGQELRVDPATLLRAGADALRFARTEDTIEAQRLARSIAAELQRQGIAPREIADVLSELGADPAEQPAKWRAVLRETAQLDSLDRLRIASEDSLLAAYAATLGTDSARSRVLREQVVEALSGDTARKLERRLSERTSELQEVRNELEEEREGFSLVRAARNLAEDLGIGFGLAGIYFTVFTVWWRGQTLGKRIVGERVVQLNGKPIGWWDAFNRFGGYAAGIATGTLGFLELVWDPNRQAAHDKMVGTVVLRTRGAGVTPGAAEAVGAGPGGAVEGPGQATPSRSADSP